jgi:hypothetical protein
VKIPERLRNFYRGDFDKYHLHYRTADVKGWGRGDTFQLALTPPTWLNKGDDAVNGPGGDWEDAKHHVPLFVTSDGLYVVANLEKPECPVGWYSEEGWSDGLSPGASSLDAFLESLAKDAGTDKLIRAQNPDQKMDWAEDFGDDGARVFDAVRDD